MLYRADVSFVQIFGIKIFLWFLSLIFTLDSVTWDKQLVEGLNFIEEYVLQVPFFLMALMRLITPTLDNLYEPRFHLNALDWVR